MFSWTGKLSQAVMVRAAKILAAGVSAGLMADSSMQGDGVSAHNARIFGVAAGVTLGAMVWIGDAFDRFGAYLSRKGGVDSEAGSTALGHVIGAGLAIVAVDLLFQGVEALQGEYDGEWNHALTDLGNFSRVLLGARGAIAGVLIGMDQFAACQKQRAEHAEKQIDLERSASPDAIVEEGIEVAVVVKQKSYAVTTLQSLSFLLPMSAEALAVSLIGPALNIQVATDAFARSILTVAATNTALTLADQTITWFRARSEAATDPADQPLLPAA